MALDTYVDVFLTSKNGDIYLFLKARIFLLVDLQTLLL